jgi:predicted nucleic acid-binding protein
MASFPRRVYWDACAWIALIQREKIRDSNGKLIEDRDQMCRDVIEAARKGKIEIVTSTLCLAEVCKHPALQDTKKADQIAAYFENDFVLLVDVDVFVGEKARELMLGGYSGLKPPDAIHIATALISPRVEEMHTFDDKLLKLTERLDTETGERLKIRKPSTGEPAPPLLEHIEKSKENDDKP